MASEAAPTAEADALIVDAGTKPMADQNAPVDQSGSGAAAPDAAGDGCVLQCSASFTHSVDRAALRVMLMYPECQRGQPVGCGGGGTWGVAQYRQPPLPLQVL